MVQFGSLELNKTFDWTAINNNNKNLIYEHLWSCFGAFEDDVFVVDSPYHMMHTWHPKRTLLSLLETFILFLPLGVFGFKQKANSSKSLHFATNAKLICRLLASFASVKFVFFLLPAFLDEKAIPSRSMKVRFSVVSFAPPGVSLGVIGSSEALGRWSLAKCVALSPRLAETRLLGIWFCMVLLGDFVTDWDRSPWDDVHHHVSFMHQLFSIHILCSSQKV